MWKQATIRSLVRRPCDIRPAGHIRDGLLNIRRSFHRTIPTKSSIMEDIMPKAIDQDELFKYTSGRWLINEKHELEQRFVKFNIEGLCRQVVSLFSKATKCVSISKLEGSFNRALLLRMDDGNEVIAKLPTRSAGIASLTTASEVATLKLLRLCTSIRVPEVFAWSSDLENPIGAEYIVMEKMPGIALAERWETMNTLERYRVIDQIIEMEKELGSLKFPAYGSLYLRESAPYGYRQYPLSPDLDPTGLFCVGPSCSKTVWNRKSVNLSKTVSDVGPWVSFAGFAQSIPQRELDAAVEKKHEIQLLLDQFDKGQSVKEYSNLLQKAKAILPTLSKHPPVEAGAAPTLWHTDLHLGNIFVSADDPTVIEGIIDWQSTRVYPLLLQARFPEFLRPPTGYKPGTVIPHLPDDFDKLDPEEKVQTTREKQQASQSKYYEMSCLGYNTFVYNAMKIDRRIWEPFTYCQLSPHGSLVPLRNTLLRISQDWDLIGLEGSCPFSFSEEDLKRHDQQVVLHQDMLYLWDIVTTQLCTDESGWVPIERWEETNNENWSLFDMYIDVMSEELPAEVASKKWPFPPNGPRPLLSTSQVLNSLLD